MRPFVVVAARQIVNVIRNHRLPPDCLPGKTRGRGVTFRANYLFRANRSLRLQLPYKRPQQLRQIEPAGLHGIASHDHERPGDQCAGKAITSRSRSHSTVFARRQGHVMRARQIVEE